MMNPDDKEEAVPLTTPSEGSISSRSSSFREPNYDEANNHVETAQFHRSSHRLNASLWVWRCTALILGVALTASLIFTPPPNPPARYPQPSPGGVDKVFEWQHAAQHAPSHLWCGNTTAEARSLGCEFNVIHNKWFRPECNADFAVARRGVLQALAGVESGLYSKDEDDGRKIDEEEQLRDALFDFPHFADENGKPGRKLSMNEVLDQELWTPGWTTTGFHITHCVYLLLQTGAALNFGKRVDMVMHAWTHSKHCAFILLNYTQAMPGWDEVTSFGHTQSGVCW